MPKVWLADLFSLRNWRRKLHIWSPNYTSTLALHELRKWLRFGYAIPTSVIRSYFWTRPPCSEGMLARLWYARIKSCNSDAGFGANIGSERSQNSLQLGKNVRVEEASVWNFFRRNYVLASKGSATVIKRKKVPSQKFLPAYHEAYPCSVPSSSRKGSELVLCTICKSDFHGGRFDCNWVSNLLRASSTRSSKQLERVFSSFKSASFSLSPPFSLSLILMQQTYSFSALTNIDSTSL